MSASAAESITQAARTPPYVPFRTFLTLLEDFKEHGLPPQIDASVLKKFSGSAGAQLAAALKALAYVDDNRKCLPALKEAVDAYKTDSFAPHLKIVLSNAYPFLNNLDLTTCTPGMFSDAFRKGTDAKEDVLRKCRAFYLQAAVAAEIELGSRLKAGTKGIASNGGPRKKSRAKARDANTNGEGGELPHDPVDRPAGAPSHNRQHVKALEYQLIDLMAEPDIVDEVKQSIWALVQYLMARKAKAAKETVGNNPTA